MTDGANDEDSDTNVRTPSVTTENPQYSNQNDGAKGEISAIFDTYGSYRLKEESKKQNKLRRSDSLNNSQSSAVEYQVEKYSIKSSSLASA